jgi:hypothetical protein
MMRPGMTGLPAGRSEAELSWPSVTAYRAGERCRAAPAVGQARTPQVGRADKRFISKADASAAGRGAVTAGATRPRNRGKTAAIAVDNQGGAP